MKPSRRNRDRAPKRADAAPPKLSKYARKTRGEPVNDTLPEDYAKRLAAHFKGDDR